MGQTKSFPTIGGPEAHMESPTKNFYQDYCPGCRGHPIELSQSFHQKPFSGPCFRCGQQQTRGYQMMCEQCCHPGVCVCCMSNAEKNPQCQNQMFLRAQQRLAEMRFGTESSSATVTPQTSQAQPTLCFGCKGHQRGQDNQQFSMMCEQCTKERVYGGRQYCPKCATTKQICECCGQSLSNRRCENAFLTGPGAQTQFQQLFQSNTTR
jgi:hypothetical protein